MRIIVLITSLASIWAATPWALAVEAPSKAAGTATASNGSEHHEFFEKQVRPLLVKHCYQCHSHQKDPKGNLRLDSKPGWLRGGDSGEVIVPGRPEESLLIQAVRYEDGLEMPPQSRLKSGEVAILERWIELGAPDSRATEPPQSHEYGMSIEEGRKHWAYIPPKMPAPPNVVDAKWPATPIDQFIRAKQESLGIRPVADADKLTLVRRLTLDLTGLPPTPEEVTAFLDDRSPNAYEKLVDRLLASDRFGEHWGRHWFDVARFVESIGSVNDILLPDAWRYRDYVIASFNRDKPYDQFVVEQLAGDLLPAATPDQRDEQLIATGFLAFGQFDYDKFNPETRMDQIDEQIDVVSKSIMATTVSCARCHDHKFDPIPTSDYHAMAGIFESTAIRKMAIYTKGKHSFVRASTGLPLQGYEADPVEKFVELQKSMFTGRNPVVRTGWEIARLKREADAAKNPQEKARLLAEAQKLEQLNEQRESRGKAAEQELRGYEKLPPMAIGVTDSDRPADTKIRIRGDVANLGEVVPRGFLQVMTYTTPPQIPAGQSGRLQLAQWLTSREHPLTARVMVNRIWHHLFGRGLVSTVDNFGINGDVPSHPELLDYLALRFMDQGWSVKRMIREVVLSRTYRLSVANQPQAEEVDADNLSLWRMNRRRLEAEVLRDSILAFNGTLDLVPQQRSLIAEIGVGQMRYLADKVHFDSVKRSVYLPQPRLKRAEFLLLFDGADTKNVVGERERTTVPSQALYLLNSPYVLEQSRIAAQRLLNASSASDAERIDLAFRLALGRPATEHDQRAAQKFLAEFSQRQNAEAADNSTTAPVKPTAGKKLTKQERQKLRKQNKNKPSKRGAVAENRQSPELEAWTAFCQTLISLPEFRYAN